MGLRKWCLMQGVVLGDEKRLMVSDQEGTTYHWTNDRADWIYIYTDGQLVESVFVRGNKLDYEHALSVIDVILTQRRKRPEAKA